MLFTGLGWSVLGETVPSVWVPRYSRPRAQFLILPIRTSQPVNYIYIYMYTLFQLQWVSKGPMLSVSLVPRLWPSPPRTMGDCLHLPLSSAIIMIIIFSRGLIQPSGHVLMKSDRYIYIYIYLSGFAKTWLQKSLLYTLWLSLVVEHVFFFFVFHSYFLFI